MSEPITSSIFSAMTTNLPFLQSLFESDYGTMMGAFAGSVIFVVSANDFRTLTKCILFFISLLVGIISADFMAAVITLSTPNGIDAVKSLGALVSSVIAVRLLIYIGVVAKNPSVLFERFWRRK